MLLVVVLGWFSKNAMPVILHAAQLPKGSMDRLLQVGAFAQVGTFADLRPYECLNPAMGSQPRCGLLIQG